MGCTSSSGGGRVRGRTAPIAPLDRRARQQDGVGVPGSRADEWSHAGFAYMEESASVKKLRLHDGSSRTLGSAFSSAAKSFGFGTASHASGASSASASVGVSRLSLRTGSVSTTDGASFAKRESVATGTGDSVTASLHSPRSATSTPGVRALHGTAAVASLPGMAVPRNLRAKAPVAIEVPVTVQEAAAESGSSSSGGGSSCPTTLVDSGAETRSPTPTMAPAEPTLAFMAEQGRPLRHPSPPPVLVPEQHSRLPPTHGSRRGSRRQHDGVLDGDDECKMTTPRGDGTTPHGAAEEVTPVRRFSKLSFGTGGDDGVGTSPLPSGQCSQRSSESHATGARSSRASNKPPKPQSQTSMRSLVRVETAPPETMRSAWGRQGSSRSVTSDRSSHSRASGTSGGTAESSTSSQLRRVQSEHSCAKKGRPTAGVAVPWINSTNWIVDKQQRPRFSPTKRRGTSSSLAASESRTPLARAASRSDSLASSGGLASQPSLGSRASRSGFVATRSAQVSRTTSTGTTGVGTPPVTAVPAGSPPTVDTSSPLSAATRRRDGRSRHSSVHMRDVDTTGSPSSRSRTPRLARKLLATIGLTSLLPSTSDGSTSSANTTARSVPSPRTSGDESSRVTSSRSSALTPSDYSPTSSRRSSQMYDVQAARDWEHHFPHYLPWQHDASKPVPHHIDLFPEHLAPHSNFEWFAN